MSILSFFIFVIFIIIVIASYIYVLYKTNCTTLSNLSAYNLLNKQHTSDLKASFLDRQEAEPNSAPYLVSIQTKKNGQLFHYCAGSILSENWVLIAAHCLMSWIIVQNSYMVAGCHGLYANEDDPRVQRRKIDKIFIHPLYVGGLSPYDIALIYTKTPFEFTPSVQRIEVGKVFDFFTNEATFHGWGNISRTEVPVFPSRLQTAKMPIINCQSCALGLGALSDYIHETHLCTGPLDGTNTLCNGDSGGPLITNNGNNKPTLVGVASWGDTPCGKINAPSIFTDVSKFVGWIEKTISQNEGSI